jgi:hypothetical protein
LEPILSRTSEPRAPYHTAGRPAAADRRNLCKNKIEVSKEEAGREEKAKRKPAGKKRSRCNQNQGIKEGGVRTSSGEKRFSCRRATPGGRGPGRRPGRGDPTSSEPPTPGLRGDRRIGKLALDRVAGRLQGGGPAEEIKKSFVLDRLRSWM